ncbi:hypothetical protein ACFXTI_005920 [Malus domestica]
MLLLKTSSHFLCTGCIMIISWLFLNSALRSASMVSKVDTRDSMVFRVFTVTLSVAFTLVESARTCEICGVTAFNISGDQINEANSSTATAASVPAPPMILVETRTMCHGRRIMNFLLACMILAFVISWFFHFKVLS